MAQGVAQPGQAALSGMLASFEDARVVLVDDRPVDVDAFRDLLQRAGLRDLHVSDSEEAYPAVVRTDPDLVVLGLLRERGKSFRLLSDIVRNAAGSFMPVLALTDGNEQTTHRALAEGARDIVATPYDPAEVLLRVRNLLEIRHLRQRQRRTAGASPETDEAARQSLCDTVLQAMTRRAFHMVFQPVTHIGTGLAIGYEALARFDIEPQRTPRQWFADAAQVGLGYALELNALSAALEVLPRLPASAFVSVNVSAETLLHPELLAVADSDVAPRLVLELTQHRPIEDYGPLCRPLARLRARGVRLALDDTGDGYDSLRHLRTLAPDIIKLDPAIVRGIDQDPARRALTAALVRFAADTQTDLVAKGVETAAELRTLTSLGVRCAQGHLLGHPEPFA